MRANTAMIRLERSARTTNAKTNLPFCKSPAGDSCGALLSPVEDQQLGGLVMWVPASFVYVVTALAIVAAWLDPGKSAFKARALGR
jgi:cytochrome c oxidase assembly factor CtaG